MASGDRFYQLDLRHRPALHGDIGSLLKIEGLVVGGEGAHAVFMLPANDLLDALPAWHYLSLEEWTDFLQRSDNPEILVMPAKAFHRKLRFEISSAVQQKVWVADALKCMYCGVAMGRAPLTIDHFVPLEMGGANDTSNYLSACRRCNKNKGAEAPQTFCARVGASYDELVLYLQNRRIP